MSSTPTLCCRTDDERRERARASKLNGLDYVEVDCEQTELFVYFLGKAPAWEITPKHLVISGGRRIRDIRVLEVNVDRYDDEDMDDVMRVRVDRSGDFSSYTLCIVALDPQTGRSTGMPPPDFDPRYACVCFSFKAACSSDADCLPAAQCAPEPLPAPVLDYTARDYATFRRLILDRLALVMPEWKERHIPDLGITLVELLAYVGDQLSYFQDAVATEAYLDTARLRISVRRHARLVDYHLHEGCNARTWITLAVSRDLSLPWKDFYFITGAPGIDANMLEAEKLPRVSPAPWLVFEPLHCAGPDALQLYKDHNEIRFHTWAEGECCIPAGATGATLVDPGEGDDYRLKLEPCDVLIFEEVRGARTTAAADADRLRRHAVRLTRVARARDPLTGTLLLEIEWCPEDALPFPLCISVMGPPPECEPVTDISVARGNVLLVDHGRTVQQDLGEVTGTPTPPRCPDECSDDEVASVADRFTPTLEHADITHATAVACCGSRRKGHGDDCVRSAASRQLSQDPRLALAQVWLDGAGASWEARSALLDSGPDDRHFVVEIDDDRVAHLRFGDGDCGRRPEIGQHFQAGYRVGNGIAGNVGADVITHIVFRNAFPQGVDILPRNPLPATGGTAPEPVNEVKLRAPFLFRTRLERAVTAEDYAAIVMRDFASTVQRAAAALRWNGTGPEIIVAVDALGGGVPDDELLQLIECHLRRYRRVGHDLHVIAARAVSLDLALTICVKPSYLRGHIKSAVFAALGSRRAASGKPGFFHPDNLSFGEGVFVSRIVATVQAIEGVESVIVTRLERLHTGTFGELEAGVLQLAPLEVARLDADPNFPENGVLQLTLRGGR
jgi:hypothetical protein